MHYFTQNNSNIFWGGGYPLPRPNPLGSTPRQMHGLDAFGVSVSAPQWLKPPTVKILSTSLHLTAQHWCNTPLQTNLCTQHVTYTNLLHVHTVCSHHFPQMKGETNNNS